MPHRDVRRRASDSADRGRDTAKPLRTFSLPWGSGVILEEVQIETAHHRPTIQLLETTEGDAAGAIMIRFCHYDLRGRFQRSPLIVNDRDLPALRAALRKAPRLRALLANLVRG